MRREGPFFISDDIDLKAKSNLAWVESSFNSDGASFHSSSYLSLSLTKTRAIIFIALLMLALVLLLGKTFYLQIIKGDTYFSQAESNRLRTEYVKANRGIILDRNGKPLVQNVSGFSLFITQAGLPKEQQQRQAVLDKIATVFGLQVSDVEEQIKGADKYYFEPITIKTGIPYEQAMALKIMSADLPGVDLEVDSWRNYLYSKETSHIMGYVGKVNTAEYEKNPGQYLLTDGIGKTGLERYYEQDLKGQHGKKMVEVDALGRERKIVSQVPFVPGSDIQLSIDVDLQEFAYRTLEKRLQGKKTAAIVISNPQNGEILALVDYPSYDNNLFTTGISLADYKALLNDEKKPLFSRSVSGEYPSGSTVKMVMAAAALQEGVVTPQTSFLSTGGIHVGSWTFPDWLAGGHGVTNLYRAIAMSVNTYFYYIGGGYGDFKGLGLERIDKYLRLFGLGERLGIDLPGESKGLVPDEEWKKKTSGEPWYIGDTYHLSIGQGGLLVTPLQVNAYNSTVANGGKLIRPHLVKTIINADGTKKEMPIEVIREGMVDKKNIKFVQDAMRQTVLAGSGRALASLPVTSAGKTGTAQWNSSKAYHAWFNAYAPFENPTFSITVLVEEGGGGDVIAVPIAKDIMNYWFNGKK
ncbi:MAG: penicillin-binding protein 2 [bacterium]